MTSLKVGRYDRLVMCAICQWLSDQGLSLDWGIESLASMGQFDLSPRARNTWQRVKAFVLLRETGPYGGSGKAMRKYVEVQLQFRHSGGIDYQCAVEDWTGQLGEVQG